MDILKSMKRDERSVIAELNAKVFLAHAEALEALGLWDVFATQNRVLLKELEEKLEKGDGKTIGGDSK